jgi:hypothetical protein
MKIPSGLPSNFFAVFSDKLNERSAPNEIAGAMTEAEHLRACETMPRAFYK